MVHVYPRVKLLQVVTCLLCRLSHTPLSIVSQGPVQYPASCLHTHTTRHKMNLLHPPCRFPAVSPWPLQCFVTRQTARPVPPPTEGVVCRPWFACNCNSRTGRCVSPNHYYLPFRRGDPSSRMHSPNTATWHSCVCVCVCFCLVESNAAGRSLTLFQTRTGYRSTRRQCSGVV